MAYQQFTVSDTNPNDNAGGGGCICDARKQTDCRPPFVIFYANDMEDPLSPHVVACKACIGAAHEALGGEILSSGERNTRPDIVPELPAPVTPDGDEDELPDI